MKKLILFFALSIISVSCTAQYPNNGRYYGNNSSNNGWYGDDDYYFPDDYYYEYPSDYYTNDYYRSFYDDYRRSITMVDWNRFFRDMNLNRWQAESIIDLNNQFPSFYVWSDYYRSNPKRWYYDRFYALERILGSRVFALYQNTFYNGYNPVNYYNNYWRDYYRPRYYTYYVVPRYRNININTYRINKYDYHQGVGNRYGWNQARNPHNPGGLRDVTAPRNGEFSNGNISTERVGNIRNGSERILRNEAGTMQNSNGMRNAEARKESTRALEDRNNSVRSQNSGLRNSQPRTEARRVEAPRAETRVQSSTRTEQTQNNSGRGSGMRTGGR